MMLMSLLDLLILPLLPLMFLHASVQSCATRGGKKEKMEIAFVQSSFIHAPIAVILRLLPALFSLFLFVPPRYIFLPFLPIFAAC